jgi:hypothetical protein
MKKRVMALVDGRWKWVVQQTDIEWEKFDQFRYEQRAKRTVLHEDVKRALARERYEAGGPDTAKAAYFGSYDYQVKG